MGTVDSRWAVVLLPAGRGKESFKTTCLARLAADVRYIVSGNVTTHNPLCLVANACGDHLAGGG